MVIKDQKDLAKLIALCRKTGVDIIKIDNIEMHLGSEPTKATSKQSAAKAQVFNSAPDKIDTDELSPDELLFYSATGQLAANEQQ